nr:3202_t:CDS:2 [Entrophospora candida]
MSVIKAATTVQATYSKKQEDKKPLVLSKFEYNLKKVLMMNSDADMGGSPGIYDLIKDMEIDNDRDVKYDFKRLKKILLSDDEWSLIEELLFILKDFYDITNTSSGNSYATLSLVYPIMSHLINKIKLQLHNDGEVEIFDEFVPPLNTEEIILDCSSEIEDNNTEEAAEEMDEIFMQADENEGLKNKILNALYSSLINYWSVTPQIGLLASALDPRFKSLTFALHRYDATYKVLSEEIKSIEEKV